MEHKLFGDTLVYARDENGAVKGIVARCTCGWTSGARFSSMLASALFRDHQDEMAEKEEEA